jgi:hypothetical protein
LYLVLREGFKFVLVSFIYAPFSTSASRALAAETASFFVSNPDFVFCFCFFVRIRVKTVATCIKDYMEEKDVIIKPYLKKVEELEVKVGQADHQKMNNTELSKNRIKSLWTN